MSLHQERIAQHQQAGLKTSVALASIILDSGEKAVALGLDAGRQWLDQQARTGEQWLTVRTPQDLADLPVELSTPWIERSLELARRSYEISTQAGEAIGQQLAAQYAEAQKSYGLLIDEFARHAPAGSEPAVAAVRSSVDVLNNTVGRINLAARQIAEATEANLAATSKATLKAVATGPVANNGAKKKAA